MKSVLLSAALCTAAISTHGQAFNYLDTGNIRSLVGSAGHLWWDQGTGEPRCEFPKGSGKHVGFTANLWVGGFDTQGQLKVAANTFRQAGNDYWQGPVNASGTSDSATHTAWDKVWKVSKADLNAFFAHTTHTVANTPDAVLRWPARGNTYAIGSTGTPLTALIGTTADFAPFVDVNNDGIYNALQGDYPRLRGDQMLWQMYNDAGGLKTQTMSDAIAIQIGLLAWAYKRGTIADNIQFYEYTITNRHLQLDSAVLGLFVDLDLGFGSDDYLGFDSTRRLGYNYNATAVDGNGQPYAYGSQIPVAGVTLVRNVGDAPLAGYRAPAGAFTYFNNSGGAATIQDPTAAVHFYRYMTGSTRGGDPFARDFTGQANTPTVGYGSGPNTRYVFDGDPATTGTWTECFSGNTAGDRRFVLSSPVFSFTPGSTRTLGMALVVAPNSGGCPNTSLTTVRQTTDTAFALYDALPYAPTGVSSIASAPTFRLFPNPANDQLFVNIDASQSALRLELFDASGRRVVAPTVRNTAGFAVTTATLVPGLYAVRIIRADGSSATATFVKQ